MMESSRPMLGKFEGGRRNGKEGGEGRRAHRTDGACEHTFAYLERICMEIAVMIML